MAFAHLPCYDIMEKVGQEVEAIRTHKAQVKKLRQYTLTYHYHRFQSHYHTSPWRIPHITSFKNNYKQVVEQIGRNSQYARKGLRYNDLNISCPTPTTQADLNSRTYKMPNGVKIITNDGKCLDRWGHTFVPIA